MCTLNFSSASYLGIPARDATKFSTDTASTANDGVLCLDCDYRPGVGPTKTIRGVFWTKLNRLERLAVLSALRERSF